ncbi:MAG TPA: hypothetical protein VF460_05380 [Burkholderiales bacterium]
MSDRGHPAASDAYPEKQERRPSAVEKALLRLAYLPQRALLRAPSPSKFAGIGKPAAGTADPSQWQQLRYDLRRHGLRDDLVRRVLRLLAQLAGSRTGRMPSRNQLAAAWLLLHGRRCVELADIDSWPLVAALAAATAALAGIPVHVIVTNGHVARRDAEAMRPLAESVGLSIGIVDDNMQDADRRAAYSADIAYCVYRTVALDYLRDRMVLKGRPRALRLRTEALTSHNPRTQHLMLRGLQFAIACEAETILVDGAQWPVSITAQASSSQEASWLGEALQLARALAEDGDYHQGDNGNVLLTDSGCARLAAAAKQMAGHWQGTKRREDIVRLALVAERVLIRDKHYTVAGEALQVGDEILRLHAPEQGAGRMLKILLELKESCTVTGTREVLARIGYQRFFRRYLRSGALVVNARGLGVELWSTYGLRIVRLAAAVPRLHVRLPDRTFASQAETMADACARVSELRGHGIPVLIVTRTPQASLAWAEAFKAAGIEHARLTGTQSDEEVAAWSEAGAAGKVTVAPYFAARGVRVRSVREIEKTGGLRVIVVQLLPSSRHLQSVMERAIPAGVPGSIQRILSLDDELLAAYIPGWWRKRHSPLRSLMLRVCQWRGTREASQARDDLLRVEDYLGDVLAFSGSQL